MSHFQNILLATERTSHLERVRDGVGSRTRGSESSPGRAVASGSGELAWTFAKCVFLAGQMTWRVRKRQPAFRQPFSNLGTRIYILHKDGICRPQPEPSRDFRITYFTISHIELFFSKLYCFLHNEKPAQEWQSIKNYLSPPLRLYQNRR